MQFLEPYSIIWSILPEIFQKKIMNLRISAPYVIDSSNLDGTLRACDKGQASEVRSLTQEC